MINLICTIIVVLVVVYALVLLTALTGVMFHIEELTELILAYVTGCTFEMEDDENADSGN